VVRRHVGHGQPPRYIRRRSRPPATTTSRSGWLFVPRPDQGAGGASGRDRAQPRAYRPRVRLTGRAGRRVRRLAADPDAPRCAAPRRGHHGPGRTGPGGAAPAARAALCDLRPAQPPGRQGRPDQVCGHPLLGAVAQGVPPRPGRAVRHPARGRDLVTGPSQQLPATHPRPGAAAGWSTRPRPTGRRPGGPRRHPAAATVCRRR
jgi:hypothetical protein